MIRRLAVALVFAASMSARAAEPVTVTIWHSYSDAEEKAFNQSVDRYIAAHPGVKIEVVGYPNEILADKISTSIPNGGGPDLFVFAHERIGGWAASGYVAPLDEKEESATLSQLLPETLPPLRVKGRLYGYPLAFKSVALFYDRKKIKTAPKTTDEMVALAREYSGGGQFGLAWETGNFFHHAPWYFGFGGELFHADGSIDWDSPGAIASLHFVRDLRRDNLVPDEITGALVKKLFNEHAAAMVVDGPWFVGGIAKDVDFGVAPLPIISATGKPAAPFVTTEAVMVSAQSHAPDAARDVARYLAGEESAVIRATVGRQPVANARAWENPAVAKDSVLRAFRDQLPAAIPTDNRPEMRSVWEPGELALKKTLRLHESPEQAAAAARRRFFAITRPPPPPADPLPYEILAVGAALAVFGWLGLRLRSIARAGALGTALRAWAWAAPATIATAVLVFFPFAVGLVLSLYDHRGSTYTFVGLANFIDILAARAYGPMEPLSFYYALAVTILWTVVNVSIHVGAGLALALLLNRPLLKLKGMYRVLLIVPWAVPNYITALLWKGLFHRQFGAINGLLEFLGIPGVAWFSGFWTAFFANVCANAWLGFPFMMVISLGALQSVPKDLYEAADVDGAGAWAKFRHVTLPSLRPALIPAVMLGIVWTFNQFNIVYLVSGGAPDNGTDILISEAYRWAFARQERYGYAAAYAALIFLLLLGWSAFSSRMAMRSAEAR